MDSSRGELRLALEGCAGDATHSRRLRREPDRWRVAAQIVQRFDDPNDNAARLFATQDKGLNR
jgi:hypothetical protein